MVRHAMRVRRHPHVHIGPVVTALAIGSLLPALACGPTETCKRYVQCQRAYDDQVTTSDYEEGGRCWENRQTAEFCEQICAAALSALAQVPNPPAVCIDGSGVLSNT